MKKAEKIHKTIIKDLTQFQEKDYRGVLAFLLVLGLITLLAARNYEGAGMLGPLAGSAVTWYFLRRRSNGGSPQTH